MGIEKVLLVLLLQMEEHFTDQVKEFSVRLQHQLQKVGLCQVYLQTRFEHSQVIGAPRLVIRFSLVVFLKALIPAVGFDDFRKNIW